MKLTKTKLKELYHKVDNKITATINRLGSAETIAKSSHPEVNISNRQDYDDLLVAAREYDINDFFVYQRPKGKKNLKIGYRIALRGYKVARDGGVVVAKKIYKLRYDK